MTLIIAACGQKGGSGKSQTIRALSADLARRKKIIVIDLDTAQRTVSEWAEARSTNKIEPAITVEVVDPDEHPDFRIPELSKGRDYVLCDAPGWSDALTLNLASWADLIVLPSEPSVDDLRPTIRLYHELVDAGIESERIVIVLNRRSTDAEAKFARDYLKKAEIEDQSVLSVEIPDHAIYRKATNVGQAITEVSNSAAQKSASDVVKAIMKTLAGQKKRVKPRQMEEAARFTLKEGESW